MNNWKRRNWGLGRENGSRADGLTGLSDFTGSVGIDQGNWGKEGWVPRHHPARARVEVAEVLAHMTCLVLCCVLACPGMVSSWAESKVCALCDTCLWHASLSESQQSHRHTQLLMHCLVSLHPWWVSLYKKYNLWILVYTGLMFFFIKFLETAVAYDVYLVLSTSIAKLWSWAASFLKDIIYFAHLEI